MASFYIDEDDEGREVVVTEGTFDLDEYPTMVKQKSIDSEDEWKNTINGFVQVEVEYLNKLISKVENLERRIKIMEDTPNFETDNIQRFSMRDIRGKSRLSRDLDGSLYSTDRYFFRADEEKEIQEVSKNIEPHIVVDKNSKRVYRRLI